MPSTKKLIRLTLIVLGLIAVVLCGSVLALLSVPRYRWRVEIAKLKATDALPGITWKELWQLNRHGDPFNLKELATTPSPYLVIRNPFASADGVAAGEKIFQSNCTVCHGANGAGGGAGPALKQRQMHKGNSDWAMFKSISNGIAGTSMPASTLPENDRWRLVAYAKSLSQGPETHANSASNTRMANLRPVSYADILAADQEPQRWLSYSGTYNGQRFSSNDQITPANVSSLRLQWMRQYTTSEILFETSPLIVDGYMFVTVPPNRVEALDAKTGELMWQFDHELPERISLCCGYVNRGLAVLGSTLFFGTLDAHLIALDIKTGAVSWDVQIADYKTGYSITSAPLVIKNMVVTGVAGGEFGIRGFVSARDVATGKEIWRFDTIPQPGEPGADTWEGDSWKTGGGPTWLTGTFDPELNVIYWPTGNPSPNFVGNTRKGDNLYTNSVVALDADRGRLRWHFQFTPHDLFDWDATEILIAFDRNVAGKRQRLIAQANRNAFYYVLDRETGKFLTVRPFSKQTWATEIDSQGRPVMNPSAIPTPEGALVYPAVGGARNWMSPSYSPVTELMYVPGMDWGGTYFSKAADYHAGETFTGGYFKFITDPPPEAVLRALDASTGEIRWEYRKVASPVGGVLSTKGGLVFGGSGQFFFALDAKTGRELWRIDTGGPVVAGPVTYSSDGKQYVTVAAGHDLLTFGL
jgi:alcohol dehydrogenase (cytochrome c)